jgi:hypothetical protein
MHILKPVILALTAVLLAVLVIPRSAVLAQAGKDGDFTTTALPCAYTFSSGSGETLFTWCLTSDGNLGRLESPAGFQHVYKEGYAVCWNDAGTNYYDYGDAEAGFAPPVVVAGCTSGSSCTLQRDTLDGNYRLRMKFTQNKNEKEINIDHTLTNLYTDSFVNLSIARQADLDMDGSAGDDKSGSSSQSVWMHQTWARIGLTRRTFGGSASAWVGGTALSGAPCSDASGGGGIDLAIGLAYHLPSIAAGKSKTFTFQYRRD